jgi:hypothetical protein
LVSSSYVNANFLVRITAPNGQFVEKSAS